MTIFDGKCEFKENVLLFIYALRGINFLFPYFMRKHDKAIICDEIEKFSENLLMLKMKFRKLIYNSYAGNTQRLIKI